MMLALLSILGISCLAPNVDSMLVPISNCRPIRVPGNPSSMGQCNRRHCLSHGATCMHGRCRCNNPYFGDGSIFCVPPGHWRCYLVNDPLLTTFTGEKFEVVAPCRSLMAQFTLFRPSRPEWRAHGSKHFVQIYTYAERNKGKIYAGGWHLRTICYRDNQPANRIEFRAFAGITTEWEFQPQIRIGGIWYNHTYHPSCSLDFSFNIDFEDKRLIFNLRTFGLRITLRPAHPLLGMHQGYTPGFFIEINPNAGDFDWTGHRATLCRAPRSATTVTMASEAANLGLESETQAAFRLAFRLPNQRNESFIPDRCGYVAEKLDDCSNNGTRRAIAVRKCIPLLRDPRFLKCLSLGDQTSGFPNLVALLHMCVEAICNPDVTMCNVLVDDVTRSCSANLPPSWTLTNDECNSMEMTTYNDEAPV